MASLEDTRKMEETTWTDKNALVSSYLQTFGDQLEYVSASLLQKVFHELRPTNTLSLRQIEASIETVCFCCLCFREEVLDVLEEMDRRYFLMKDLEWEFAMLDCEKRHTITENEAQFLFDAIHGENASRKWQKFISSRAMPGSRVTLAEVEVHLCDPKEDFLPSDNDEKDKE